MLEEKRMKPLKVVRVTKTEFELEGGRVYPVPFDMDEVPTVEEFQEILNETYDKFADFLPDDSSSEEE